MKTEQEYLVKPAKNPTDICAEVPGSKSITNRALLIAALCKGKSCLRGVLFSDDSRHFLQALVDLGFCVEIDEEKQEVSIVGLGGEIPKKEAKVQVGSAGTAARFLTAYLGLSNGSYTMDASEQMKKRPMQELLQALEELGANIAYQGEVYHFPYTIGNEGIQKQEVTIDVDKSSQFLSALLIVSVLFEEDFVIHVTGTHGMAYVEMTIQMMQQFGYTVRRDAEGRTFFIDKDASYQAREYQIEPDLSAACYFYAAGALQGVSAKVRHVHWNSMQGDINFLHVLGDMGCFFEEDEDGIRLLPAKQALCGGRWDLSAFSDQALTLAAVAPFCTSSVTIAHVGHIRYQECDRIEAILTNLRAMGVQAQEENGTIVISPVYADAKITNLEQSIRIQTYNDHRVAMAFSIAGLRLHPLIIEDPSCCRKTFEDYFEVFEETVCK